MKRYLEKIKELTTSFLIFDIRQVPQAQNTRADALSKLAASLPPEIQKKTYVEVLENSSLKESLAV